VTPDRGARPAGIQASLAQAFRTSPFGPLGLHMAEVKACVALVRPMIEALRAQDYGKLTELANQTFKKEHDADIIKTEIREALPKSFNLPVYRGDLLAFLALQDDIADSVEDLAVVLTLKKLAVPPKLVEDVRAYVECVLNTCDYLFRCTDQLADFTEADFGGPRGKQILELVAKAEHAEWESDKSAYHLSQRIYELEDEIRATDIFLWSQVIRTLGQLANHADHTAGRLRRMLVR